MIEDRREIQERKGEGKEERDPKYNGKGESEKEDRK